MTHKELERGEPNGSPLLFFRELRGRCGVEGAYQLDHIVSLNEGWEQGIPPEEIADWNNLRMIPWAENREKW